MPIEVIRVMGQDVPDEARDPESTEYLDWLTRSREEFVWRQEMNGRNLLGEYFQMLLSTKTNIDT